MKKNEFLLSTPIEKIASTNAEKLAKMHIYTVWDLWLHLPLRYDDETHITPIADVKIGHSAMVEGEVIHQEIQFHPRKQLIAKIKDSTGSLLMIRLLHFYPGQQKQLSQGTRIRAVGEVRMGYWGREMVHPKLQTASNQPLCETLTPVYPTVSGVQQNTLRRLIASTIENIDCPDTLPEAVLEKLNLPHLRTALEFLHFPPPDVRSVDWQSGNLPAINRLKFDELLAHQLSMKQARNLRQQESAEALTGKGQAVKQLLAQLPFALTGAQKKCFEEISTDLKKPHPMHRLLQGDVGSGKTIVAALSALIAWEAGFQVAIMAPTEILAEQHFVKFSHWFNPLGIDVAFLSGALKKKEKSHLQAALAGGHIRVVVGTHALFQDSISFEKLGLVIVDEQHRFGVSQRLLLKNKGQSVHQLMMSATPIPRTLAMSFFADLDVSVIDELPPGRTPIMTKLINNTRRREVEQFVHQTVLEGRQVYWVCPLIEESDALQLKTATETFESLQAIFVRFSVGLIHGRMKPAEKAEVMQKFLSGEIKILVATTVIEVGVDVPNAALMVIEHAERMGLSQLHQLRGRVGRGAAQSVCILLFAQPLSDMGKARLKIIFENTDGFEIARQDLALRGPGEFLGARQSGLPMLRFAHLEEDTFWLETARDWATQLWQSDQSTARKHLDRWLSRHETYLGV